MFIGEDDLQTFEGWLRYMAVDPNPAVTTPEELAKWREIFDEQQERNSAAQSTTYDAEGEFKFRVAEDMEMSVGGARVGTWPDMLLQH